MKRREYLRRTSALLAAGAMAGCLGSNVPGDSTERVTETTAVSPVVATRDFEVTRQECGTEVNTARVEAGDEQVTVTGTITGSDACKTAELKTASVEKGTLRVVVAAVNRADAGACAQCLSEIDYEATVSFEGGTPESVVVVHESIGEPRTVADTGTAETTSDGTTGEETTDEPTTDGDEETTEGESAIAESNLRLVDQGCGEGADSASVSFGASDVTVEGTIGGSDTCKVAELRETAYDAASGKLRVVVGTTDATAEGETPVCGECIVDIEYEAVVRFEGDTPTSVTVVHESVNGTNTVATASN